MPVRIICGRCNAVLYEGAEIKAPYEVVAEYEGKCPKCARKLSQMPQGVEVRPVSVAD